MTQAEAMAHLGLRPGVTAGDIRRAFRLWARLAHPDRGGNPDSFRVLQQARDVLLSGAAVAKSAEAAAAADRVLSRARLRDVLRIPSSFDRLIIAVVLACAVALVWLPVILATAPLALSAAPAAVAAAGAAVLTRDRILLGSADVGHRITGLVLVWVPTVAIQVLWAQFFAVSLVTVLPVFALPFVAVVAAVNPGAGLCRRPIS